MAWNGWKSSRIEEIRHHVGGAVCRAVWDMSHDDGWRIAAMSQERPVVSEIPLTLSNLPPLLIRR